MTTFIRPRTWEHVEKYLLMFNLKTGSSSGYAFDCTRDGVLIQVGTDEEHAKRVEHVEELRRNSRYHPAQVIDLSTDHPVHAIIKCDECGSEVHLTDPLTNGCDNEDCSAEYNMSGQRVFNELAEEPWDEGDY